MTPPVPGADALALWFGSWPSFHDAEVLDLHLRRAGTSLLNIYTWRMTNQVDERGYFVLNKQVIVTLRLENISELVLEDFSSQNVINGLNIVPAEGGYTVTLDALYGICGAITAGQVSVAFSPGELSE